MPYRRDRLSRRGVALWSDAGETGFPKRLGARFLGLGADRRSASRTCLRIGPAPPRAVSGTPGHRGWFYPGTAPPRCPAFPMVPAWTPAPLRAMRDARAAALSEPDRFRWRRTVPAPRYGRPHPGLRRGRLGISPARFRRSSGSAATSNDRGLFRPPIGMIRVSADGSAPRQKSTSTATPSRTARSTTAAATARS